jgi:hypothetical protein
VCLSVTRVWVLGLPSWIRGRVLVSQPARRFLCLWSQYTIRAVLRRQMCSPACGPLFLRVPVCDRLVCHGWLCVWALTPLVSIETHSWCCGLAACISYRTLCMAVPAWQHIHRMTTHTARMGLRGMCSFLNVLSYHHKAGGGVAPHVIEPQS